MQTERKDSAPRGGYATRVLTVITVLFCLAAATAKAQEFERYRPKIPYNLEGEAKLPELPKEATGDTAILVDELKALIFVDHPDKVVLGKLEAEGIRVESERGLSLLRSRAFRRRMAPYLGGPISIRRLNQLAREVILFYRQNDQPVVDVSIPEQDVTDGVVQVVVTEARVGEVRVEDACYFDPCILARQAWVCSGDKIYESVLLEDLNWLNRNPFREVDLELTPGKDFGETDIVFHVHDRRPVRFYTGYEDSGTRETGLERILFGANWGNALWRDHQVGYQYTTSGDFESLHAHSGIYSIPLLNRDTVVAYGSWAELESRAAPPFDCRGMAWQAGIHYNRMLPPYVEHDHYLVVGFEFKQTNTDLEFGGTQVYDTSADLAQLVVGYHRRRYGDRGSLALGADLYIGPGGFSAGDNDFAYQQIRSFAHASYVYSRLYAERQIWLPWNLTFLGRVTGQVADGNLLPSEQLFFGGFNSIRGYDMCRVLGDSGYLVNLEIRTDPISLGLGRRGDDGLQFLGFYDLGGAMNHTLLPGEDPHVDLASAGLGVRYSLAPDVMLRFDYGWQINRLPGDPISSRPHVGVVLSR